MNKTKEKQATVKEFTEVLKELLKTHIVGFLPDEGENGFDFCLPGGRAFHIFVEEK